MSDEAKNQSSEHPKDQGTQPPTAEIKQQPIETEAKQAQSVALTLRDSAGQLVSLDYGEDAGQGMSFADQGGRLPYISLLQPLSKALKRNDETFIPGAQAGDFCIGPTKTVFSGEKGFYFIGICEEHVFVEKTALDSSGKWVADHSPDDPAVKQALAAGGKRNELKIGTNPLVETYRMYGVVYENEDDLKALRVIPCVMSFERTKLAARRKLMDRIRQNKKALPLYAVRLKVTSKPETWKKGDGFGPVVRFAVEDDLLKSLILPTDPIWAEWSAQCRKVVKGVQEGRLSGDVASHQEADGGGNGDDDVPF